MKIVLALYRESRYKEGIRQLLPLTLKRKTKMATWKQVIANSNLIQTEIDNAYLIKLPKSELKFWHPKKLVRISGKNGYRMSISFTDSFEFKVFRNGNGKHNFKEIIEQKILTPAEFEIYYAS